MVDVIRPFVQVEGEFNFVGAVFDVARLPHEQSLAKLAQVDVEGGCSRMASGASIHTLRSGSHR